jgi:hypothetical protein
MIISRAPKVESGSLIRGDRRALMYFMRIKLVKERLRSLKGVVFNSKVIITWRIPRIATLNDNIILCELDTAVSLWISKECFKRLVDNASMKIVLPCWTSVYIVFYSKVAVSWWVIFWCELTEFESTYVFIWSVKVGKVFIVKLSRSISILVVLSCESNISAKGSMLLSARCPELGQWAIKLILIKITTISSCTVSMESKLEIIALIVIK